jgi:DNA polymerase
MSGAPDVSSPLRRAWLRELGIERVWSATAPVRAEGLAAAGASRVAAPAEIAAPVSAAVAQAPATTGGASTATALAPTERLAAETQSAPAALPATANPTPPARPSTGRVTGPAQIHREALASLAAMPRTPVAPPVTQAEANSWSTGDPDADWAALQQEVSVCTACALSKSRTQTVFGSGPRSAAWLLIGEAPGEQEDRQGVPFVGRSGQLLENMLGAIDVQRARGEVFVTNIVKCRPPGNRNPEPEEAAACRPFLERQVALLAPQRALAVGRIAAQNVLGSDATIGSLRGRVHRLALGGKDIPMVVSYHPAYLLRAPLEKTKAWHDLKLVSGVSESS